MCCSRPRVISVFAVGGTYGFDSVFFGDFCCGGGGVSAGGGTNGLMFIPPTPALEAACPVAFDDVAVSGFG